MEGRQCWLDGYFWELEPFGGVEVQDVNGAPTVHQCLGQPVVGHLWPDHQVDSPWILNSWRVVLATLGDALFRPV